MTSLATEKQLLDELTKAGFDKTQFITETGSVWVHRGKKHHLIVPNSHDGFYPSWLLAELVAAAESFQDGTATALDSLPTPHRL